MWKRNTTHPHQRQHGSKSGIHPVTLVSFCSIFGYKFEFCSLFTSVVPKRNLYFGGIIHREKSELIDSKLHSTDEPQYRKTTVSVVVDDSLDFITVGSSLR